MVVRRVAVETDSKPSSKDGGFYADLDAAKRGRSCFGCGGCLGALALFLLAVVLGCASLVAATGYARIPGLSDLIYKEEPQPRRTVEAAHTGGLAGLIQTKAAALGPTGGTVTLTEGELTGALREPNASGELFLKQGQVSVDTDGIELYGQVGQAGSSQPVILRAYLAPSTAEVGQIALTKLFVGNVSIPLQYARTVIEFFLGIDVGTTETLSSYGVQSVTLGQGTVNLQLSSPSFNLNSLQPDLNLGTLSPESITPKILPSTEVPAVTE